MSDQQYYFRPDGSRGKREPSANNGPAHRAPKRRLTNSAKRRRVALVLVAFIILGLVGTYSYARLRFSQIRKIGVSGLNTAATNQPMNILLVGNNSRTVLNGSQANAFGNGSQVGGARSDVTMIAHLDPSTHRVTLVSIPRDLFLPIPGSNNLNRVDAALNSGPSMLVKTIEQDLGIPIDHYVELNFDTFQQIVTALGGINMYFPYQLKDAQSGLNITHTGCIHLNGFQALAVVRARHLQYSTNGVTWGYDPLGDLSRIRRDHEFIKVLASEVQAKGIYNPVQLNSLVNAITPYLGLDKTFSLNDLISLATTFRHVNPNTVATATLPIAFANNYVYLGASYGDVVFAAEPQDSTVLNRYLGLPTPNIAPSSITVGVVNGTGAYHLAADVAKSLSALGYKIAGTANTAIQGTNLETIVRYTKGHLALAERVKADLSGAVVMGEGSTISGAPVEVIAGNNLTVATPPAPTTTVASTQGTSAPKTTGASSTNSNLPITLPATTSNMALQPWDPRACPAS